MAAPDPHFTEFARSGSEEAFQRLVERHMDMVYSAARRLLGDRRDAAADVAQTVFSQLARRAALLPTDLVVSVWLYARTRHAALNVVRSETRRAFREQTAAELMRMNATDPDLTASLMPHIDGAIAELPKVDQRALILRFFEQCELQEIGDRLGLSAGAVRQRLTRALEKLRTRLARRGVTLSAAALTLWLSNESVKAAPAVMTASGLTAAALQSTVQGAGGVFTILTFMTGIKSILIGIALGLVGGGLWAARTTGSTGTSHAASSESLFPPTSPAPRGGNGAAAAQRFAMPVPGSTAEELLSQLNSFISVPETELTRQRLKVWLEGVRPDLWKPLLALADLRLSQGERVRWLPELARQWAGVAPATAIPGLANVRNHGSMGADRLVAIGFQVWYGSSADKALTWLVEHQEDPGLAATLPGMITVVAKGLLAKSHDGALRWAAQLRGNDLQEAALQPVWDKLKMDKNPAGWEEICGKLLLAKDGDFRHMALSGALSRWSAYDVSGEAGLAGAEKWLASLPPSEERREVAELILTKAVVRSFPANRPDYALGMIREEGPQEAAAAAVRAIRENGDFLRPEALPWLLPLLTGPERESAILHAARQLAFGANRSSLTSASAIQWAAELGDPALRDPLIYGICQEWLSQRKDHKVRFTESPGELKELELLPPAIQKVMRDAQRDFETKGTPSL